MPTCHIIEFLRNNVGSSDRTSDFSAFVYFIRKVGRPGLTYINVVCSYSNQLLLKFQKVILKLNVGYSNGIALSFTITVYDFNEIHKL